MKTMATPQAAKKKVKGATVPPKKKRARKESPALLNAKKKSKETTRNRPGESPAKGPLNPYEKNKAQFKQAFKKVEAKKRDQKDQEVIAEKAEELKPVAEVREEGLVKEAPTAPKPKAQKEKKTELSGAALEVPSMEVRGKDKPKEIAELETRKEEEPPPVPKVRQGEKAEEKAEAESAAPEQNEEAVLEVAGEDLSGGNAPAPSPELAKEGEAVGKKAAAPAEKKTVDGGTPPGVPKASGDGGGAPDTVAKVEAVSMEGNSEESMEAFTRASASQVAASYGGLGSAISGKMQGEQQDVAASTPALSASTAGPQAEEGDAAEKPKQKTAETVDGVTEGEPVPVAKEEHENFGPAIDNQEKNKKLDSHSSDGFMSWFKNSFGSFIGGIKTEDDGINTSAGPEKKIELSGKANPDRTASQRDAGQSDVSDQQASTKEAIQNNPGKKNIQPQLVDEQIDVGVATEVTHTPETLPEPKMEEFAALPLPENVRQAADARMAPMMEKSLAGPRGKAKAAALKRDTDKKAAVDKAETDNHAMNQKAEKDQADIVDESRGKVQAEQDRGVQEAQDKLDNFKTEADAEQGMAEQAVQERITKDEGDAKSKMKEGETKATEEKKKGEEKAAAKKEEMEKESENDSWWDRAVSAVKSVVKAITSAIDAVFDAVRKVVSAIIDTFVNLATAIIEAGRKWIIEKLDAFGSWLKSKVDKYLSAFPALQKALNDAIDSTVNAAKAAVNAAADRLISGIKAIGEALKNAINSLLDKFQVAMKAAVAIAGALLTGDFTEALKIAFLAAAEIAGIDPKPILDFINRAGESIIKIFKDPIQFFKNLASGVGKGLDQFVTNIKKHLLNGLIGWLTGSLSEAGITLPETFDLKGVFTLVAQILGLTYENIRAKIVKKLGPKAETIISAIEKSVIFVKDLITKGPIALWEKIKESLSDLKTTVMNGIRDFIITTVIKEGIIWIISLLNPASAIVKAIKMLFDVVMFLVERFDQIKNFVLTVYGTVKDIVAGNVAGVAKGVEGALAKSIPVVISFMASLLGLGGIGKTIKDIIAKVKKPIDKAIDKVIDWVVKKGKALLGKAKSVGKKVKEKVVSVFSWWKAKKTFKAADGKSHKLYFTGSGKSAKLTMASKPITYTSYIGDIKIADTDPKKAAKKAALTKAKALAKQIDGLKTKTATKTGVKDETPAFNKLLEDLSVHTALLATDPNGEMPPSTKPIYGGLKNGFGSSMEIKTLTKIKPPGSTPAVSSPLWERLNVRRSGKGSYYILGHLLNNNLGGPGTTWANLTPLSRSGNSQHEVQVESKVKTAVDAGSIIRYKVVPNYPGKANPLKTSILAIADPQRKAKSDIIDAESKIPNELGCSVFEFDPATKKEKALFSKDVPNKIENTKPEHYEVAGIPPPQLVNLSLKSPKTKEDYENLPGVAGSIADTMFSLKDQYKVWKDVWEKTAGVTEDMVSDWRKGGKFTVTLSGSTRSQ